jgi:hypothetical protein
MAAIIAKTDHLVKSKAASGASTLNCGDEVAEVMSGCTLAAVHDFAAKYDIDVSKYSHLNPGHQRMVIGNVMRKKFRQMCVPVVPEPNDQEDAPTEAELEVMVENAYDAAVSKMTADMADSVEATEPAVEDEAEAA